jgi:hypothetical protein
MIGSKPKSRYRFPSGESSSTKSRRLDFPKREETGPGSFPDHRLNIWTGWARSKNLGPAEGEDETGFERIAPGQG